MALSLRYLFWGRLGPWLAFGPAPLVLIGCAASGGGATVEKGSDAAPSESRAKVSPHRPAPFSTRELGELAFVEQEVVLRVVEPSMWRRLPRRGEWSGRLHPESQSEVWVRHVLARRTVEVDECEDDSRKSLSLLRKPLSDEAFESVQARDHYRGRTRMVLSQAEGGRVESFFVGPSRCLSVVYISGVRPGFPERLQFFFQSIDDSVRLFSIEERQLGKRWEPY